jgi:flavin-dependent dehydrogenase
MWDAIIAGAGPAGAVAAGVLARAGHRVLVVDLASSLSYKIGEALPGAALRLLRSLHLPVPEKNGPHKQIGGNLSSWNTKHLISTDFLCDPDGYGWRLERARFDSALREAAVWLGAVEKCGRVTALARCEDLWRLSFSNGESESGRWVVDATGRRAFLARRLGARRLIDTRLTAIYALGHTKQPIQLDRTIVEAVPQGWWYAARLPSGALLAGLHLSPHDAARFSRNRSLWLEAFAETRNIAKLFPDCTFGGELHVLDASGSRLDHPAGDAWIACGDAALSFDPLSAQGLFSAIHGGMMAGRSVSSALQGIHGAMADYIEQLEQIWQIYSKRLRAMYRSETRWPAHPFWSTIGTCRARSPRVCTGEDDTTLRVGDTVLWLEGQKIVTP